MDDELLDLVDENDNVIGKLERSRVHNDPSKYHREISVVLFSKNSEVLLQKRSMNRKNDPGGWQLSSAGHVLAGQDPSESAERELYEETGIKAKLIYLYKFLNHHKKENRFFYIYYGVVDKKKIKLKPDQDEVAELRWVKFSELEKYLMKTNGYSEKGSLSVIREVLDRLGDKSC